MSLDKMIADKQRRKRRHPLLPLLAGLVALAVIAAGIILAQAITSPVPEMRAIPTPISTTPPPQRTPTPTQTAQPTRWTVRKETSPDGLTTGVVDDPRVVEQVKADYLAFMRWFYQSGRWDISRADTYAVNFWIGDVEYGGLLDLRRLMDHYLNQEGYYFQIKYLEEFSFLLFDFALDGRSVTMLVQVPKRIAQTYEAKTNRLVYQGIYEPYIGQVVMAYADGRWKVVRLEPKAVIPSQLQR